MLGWEMIQSRRWNLPRILSKVEKECIGGRRTQSPVGRFPLLEGSRARSCPLGLTCTIQHVQPPSLWDRNKTWCVSMCGGAGTNTRVFVGRRPAKLALLVGLTIAVFDIWHIPVMMGIGVGCPSSPA